MINTNSSTVMRALLSLTFGLTTCMAMAGAKDLSTDKAKVSYLIGRQMGESLARPEVSREIDIDVLCTSLREAFAGKESRIPMKEARAIMGEFSQRMQQRMQQQQATAGKENREKGAAYLAANAKKKGWKKTDSGLQYRVIREGKGAKPKSTDVVEVNYRGSFIDGKEFDSSYKRGQSVTFPVGNVIKGWQEALQMMPVGSKWELVIPSELAYGSRGKGPQIGPDSVLCFEVELLGIKNPGAGAKTP